MTNVFTIGKTYAITGYNDTIKVVKRTDKSVWFEYAGETLRKKIHNVSSGEKVVLDGGSACVFPESVIEPQASVNEVETIELQANNVVSLSDYRFSAKFSDTHAIIVESLEPIEDVESAEIISLDELDLIHLIQDLTLIELENANRKKLETLESDTTEILETLEFPQDSTQELDRFEVTYQVLDCDDEVSYESRTVYALSHEHAKSIVSLDLRTQHVLHIITGCEYALVIDDLSDFSLVDEF